jgi:hypothetical protein
MADLVQIASTPRGASSGCSLYVDRKTGRLHFTSWYDGSFLGPDLAIDFNELHKRVAMVLLLRDEPAANEVPQVPY